MILHKLVILGDAGVGKTALAVQFCLEQFEESYDPTIEASYRKRLIIEKQLYVLDILDTAGEEAYSGLRAQWIRGGEVFMLVYSISSRESFAHAERLYRDVRAINGTAPVILVANKSDCIDRIVSFEEGCALARRLNCGFSEASAKAGSNVENVFFYNSRQLRHAKSDEGVANSNAGNVRSRRTFRTHTRLSFSFLKAVKAMFH